MGRRLLVVLAHPDDETFICGAAIAAFAAAGGSVRLLCATRGEHGRRLGKPPFATRERLPEVREAETRAACAALGVADVAFLGLRDKCLEFEDADALAAAVAVHIRRWRPEGVVTFHEARGGHTDHCAIGRAATLAWQRSPEPDWHPEQWDGLAAGAAPGPRLYWIAGRELSEHPERFGSTSAAVTTVSGSQVSRRVMEAHRAHRTQTELDAGLWGEDAPVLERFARRREIYQQAAPPFAAGERGLLGTQTDGSGDTA